MLNQYNYNEVLQQLGLENINLGASDGQQWLGHGKTVDVLTPIDGSRLASVKQANADDYEQIIAKAAAAFNTWRMVPAPQRGEIVRQLGEELRKNKEALGKLVTIEMGKSIQEGLGEVQEMIDICDYACGQSRMLYGVQTHSERARHRMFEQWHPLGIVGIISAFNFPVAVWSWNLCIALICGDVCVWKPASATPLTAIACQKIIEKVLKANGLPAGIACLITGKGSEIGERLNLDRRIPLISYTGSTKSGIHISKVVAERLGKTILELGGNNAIIVTKNADVTLAAKNILFGAVGTSGQRCTSTRRVIIAESVYAQFTELLLSYYKKITIGNPLSEGSLMGPLVDTQAVDTMMKALDAIRSQGGKIIYGGERLPEDKYPGGCYVIPAIAEVTNNLAIVQEETFAPILYLVKYKGDVESAIKIQNDVPQGLSSAIFTNNLIESEQFLSHAGSDCGIANVNAGTSGAEIGLAFGGEKETGGGRESGSDAWKVYMRRQTNTLNWSETTALAQGIKFD
ncbi:MAG: aldehyde dehydrogenase family protein [Deltaproteobacteria bacterium]|nr:aldehyde dehydrogenase family protein [Deltaproteobacteria bacterium]